MSDINRKLGVIFADISCEREASKVMRASWTWGGLAALFIDRTGTARAVADGTVEAERLIRADPDSLVGVYRFRTQEPKQRLLTHVAEDIWHHMSTRHPQ